MKDWRDYFNERMAWKVKYEQALIARGDRKPRLDNFEYEFLKYLIEACRDEAYVNAGGKPTDINLGPDHPAIRAVRAVRFETLRHDTEKMHYVQAALAALPPGLVKSVSDWNHADRIRFVSGKTSTLADASP